MRAAERRRQEERAKQAQTNDLLSKLQRVTQKSAVVHPTAEEEAAGAGDASSDEEAGAAGTGRVAPGGLFLSIEEPEGAPSSAARPGGLFRSLDELPPAPGPSSQQPQPSGWLPGPMRGAFV